MILTALDTILILQGESPTKSFARIFIFLLKPVHALYRGNTVVRHVAACFFLIEIVVMVVGLAMSLPNITYDNLCLVVTTLIIYA